MCQEFPGQIRVEKFDLFSPPSSLCYYAYKVADAPNVGGSET